MTWEISCEMSDYLVFPNLYIEEKMSGAFNLKELYRGTILREGYPRNSIFFDQEHGRLLKEVLGYQGCQLSVYMPTFRGRTDDVEGDTYVEQVRSYLEVIDKGMQDDQILLLKLHPLVQKGLDLDNYRHIRPFPSELDTYDVLNACDVQIIPASCTTLQILVVRSSSLPMTLRIIWDTVACTKTSAPTRSRSQ